MSKTVLPFPHEGSETSLIPVPANSRPGVTFIRVNVSNDRYSRTVGFLDGTVLVAQVDEIKKGFLHYVELHGRGFLARVTAATETKIHLAPLDGATPEGAYRREDLNCIGAIVEIYPRGLNGSRWVLYPARDYGAVQPVVSAVAN